MKVVLVALAALTALIIAPAARAACSSEVTLPANQCFAPRPYVQMSASVTSPHAGSPVTLSANSAGRGIVYTWDLDGDGAYDDATGASLTTTLPAGPRTVGVRATDDFGRTATETRTIIVHDWNARPVMSLKLSTPTPRAGKPFDVTVTASDVDSTIPQIELDLDGDGTYEAASPGGGTVKRSVTLATAGLRTLRARVIDNGGAAAVATAQVDVSAVNLPPQLTADVRNGPDGLDDDAIWAGEPTSVHGYGTDPDGKIVRYEFDLDGDGTYETDRGSSSTVMTTFDVGMHEVGVRATDSDGATATSRRTLDAIEMWTCMCPVLFPVYASDATAGIAKDLVVGVWGATSVEWDIDGDGEFDDATAAVPPHTIPQEIHLLHTFEEPGTYDVSFRATDGEGHTRVLMRTVTVHDPGPAGVTQFSVWGDTLRPGADLPLILFGPPGQEVSYDLDGDGEFDDSPGGLGEYQRLRLTGPTTIAVKATTGPSTVVHTLDLAPLAGNLGPFPQLGPELVGYDPNHEPYSPFLAGYRTHFDVSLHDVDARYGTFGFLDTNGDGRYETGDDAWPSVGPLTIGLRVLDDGDDDVFVRQSFTVGTIRPTVWFHTWEGTATAYASDPEGRAIASWAWDLDGDGAFDDATSGTAPLRSATGLVGLMGVDADGDIGIFYSRAENRVAPPPGVPAPNPPAPVPPAPGPTATPPAPPLELRVRAPKLTARAVFVRATCSAKCRTTVVVKLGRRVLGKAAGRGGKVKVKLSRKARRLIARSRGRKITITVSAPGAKRAKKTMRIRHR